jgi:hypothetical protein
VCANSRTARKALTIDEEDVLASELQRHCVELPSNVLTPEGQSRGQTSTSKLATKAVTVPTADRIYLIS